MILYILYILLILCNLILHACIHCFEYSSISIMVIDLKSVNLKRRALYLPFDHIA